MFVPLSWRASVSSRSKFSSRRPEKWRPPLSRTAYLLSSLSVRISRETAWYDELSWPAESIYRIPRNLSILWTFPSKYFQRVRYLCRPPFHPLWVGCRQASSWRAPDQEYGRKSLKMGSAFRAHKEIFMPGWLLCGYSPDHFGRQNGDYS